MTKISLLFGLITLIVPFSALATAPQFSDYPVTKIYDGPNHFVVKEVPSDETFSDRHQAFEEQKSNFAGHYIIYTKPSNNDFIFVNIADARTGKDINNFGPYHVKDKNDVSFSLAYNLHSNLLIITGTRQYIWEHPAQIYWIMGKGEVKGYYDFHRIEQNKKDFDKYCHDLNDKKFDGSSDFLCIYPNKTINNIITKLRSKPYDRRLFSYPPPPIGKKKSYALKNDDDGLDISYEWLSIKELKIRLSQFSRGNTIYTIKQEQNQTSIHIHTEKPKSI